MADDLSPTLTDMVTDEMVTDDSSPDLSNSKRPAASDSLPSRPTKKPSSDGNLAPSTPCKTSKLQKDTKHTPDSLVAATHVKGLFSTGLFEGLPVTYMFKGAELLDGTLKDRAYQCGCSKCDNNKILSALQFEQHAEMTTNNPNNHIHLPSGISLYALVKELGAYTLGSLGDVIEGKIGCSANMKGYNDWKESFRAGSNGVQMSSVENIQTETGHRPQTMSGNDNGTVEVQLDLNSDPLSDKRSMSLPKIASSSKYDGPLQAKTVSQGGGNKRGLHQLLFVENGIEEGTELEYRHNGEVKLQGMKQGTGILCKCCNMNVSPSKFEQHAGYEDKRQPYQNIYIKNGSKLRELYKQLMGQCIVCGGRGDLFSCVQCTKAFHAACVTLNCEPGNELHCPDCKLKVGSNSAARLTPSIPARPRNIRLTRIFKDTPDELDAGCVLCKKLDLCVKCFCDRVLMICRQCEKQHHIGCLKSHGLFNIEENPGEWFCSLCCNVIHFALRNLVQDGPKVVPESLLGFLKQNEEEPSTKELGSKVQWRLLCKGWQRCKPLYQQVEAIFKESFHPIVEQKVDLLPAIIRGEDLEEPEQYFRGMYCAALTKGSVIVSAGILKIFGNGVAELPLVATTRGSQRKGYFRTLFSLIELLLSRLKVEVLVIPVAEEEQEMWINKFGFTKMSEKQWRNYGAVYHFLEFKNMIWLEKPVPQSSSNLSEELKSGFIKSFGNLRVQ